MTAGDARARALARLADAHRLLVALDFDGTVSPLVDDPMTARMLPAARNAVQALTARPRTTVALVSGRSLSDLRLIAEHDDDSPILLAGSHGAEYWLPDRGRVARDDDPAELVLRDRLQADAERATRGIAGVWIEPKTFGFGVHTRRADPEGARAANDAVDAIVRIQASHWRRRTGHSIVEYAFRDEGKDTAVRTLRARCAADAVLFAGDDTTDEDALRALEPGDAGVRISATPVPTAADIVLPDIPAFAQFLSALADARRTAQ